jgi:HNH endonuclease
MPSPPPCLSPSAEHLRASLPSPALAWPCGPLTCTGKCQLCGVSLKSGLTPRLPGRPRRSRHAGSPDAYGYIRVTTPFARLYLHRLVYEVATGLAIPPGWHVHHIDGQVTHNCPHNLQALPNEVHGFISSQRFTLVHYCAFCGRPFRCLGRTTHHTHLCCSRSCSARRFYGWPPPPPCCPYDIFVQSTPNTPVPLTPCLTYDQPSLFPH